MKRRGFRLAALLTFCCLLLLLGGCGSSGNKEGDAATASTLRVSETACMTCHSTSVESLTGALIGQTFATSVHMNASVGCQDCHGAGGAHNGVGPIPFPNPTYAQCQGCHDSGTATNYPLVTEYVGSRHLVGTSTVVESGEPCNRCHTHQGAVLAAVNHFTGDGDVMEAGVNAPVDIPEADAQPIKCNTCHQTHDSGKLLVDNLWNPSLAVGAVAGGTPPTTFAGNAQYRLCTQCHGYITPGGQMMGSGTVASGTALVGHHETSWYRIIGTTHWDNPATASDTSVEGYGMRFTKYDGTVNPNPCFDCHGHEALTNTNNDPATASYDPTKTTVYTDWAQSGHARGLLTAKFAAARSVVIPAGSRTDPARVAAQLLQVDTVAAAAVGGGAFAGHNTGSCARCHSTEGFAYYNDNLASIPSAAQAGVLKCYGCHTNPAAGTLRTLKGAKATTNYTTDLGWNPPGYTLNYGKLRYPDVAASNLCIECHDSRERDPGAINDTNNANYLRTHYLQAATLMYVKMGFIAFNKADGTVTSGADSAVADLMSNQDSGSITSTHRKLGTPAMIGDHGITAADTDLLSRGPCVTCHFTGSHSQKIDQKAIDAVCIKCHDSEAGHSIATAADFETYFLGPQREAYEAALTLAIAIFNNKNTGITLAPEPSLPEFVRAYQTATVGTTNVEAAAGDWTTAMGTAGLAGFNKTKVLGAVSNVVLFKRDPGGYAHARTYSRRLLYDTIDYLDNGLMDKSVSATALTLSGTVGSPVFGLYGKGASAFTDGTLTTLAPGTTEAMTFLIKWSRTDGTWSAPERP